jgi:hypothetical protein
MAFENCQITREISEWIFLCGYNLSLLEVRKQFWILGHHQLLSYVFTLFQCQVSLLLFTYFFWCSSIIFGIQYCSNKALL